MKAYGSKASKPPKKAKMGGMNKMMMAKKKAKKPTGRKK